MELLIANSKYKKLWNETVTESIDGTIFHTWDWLKILEKNSGLKLYPAMVLKGEQVFSLFPIFKRKRYFLKFGYSPPSGLEMTYLGPIYVKYLNLKQNKKEEKIFEAQKQVDAFLFEEEKYNFFDFGTPPGFSEVKPYIWLGYSIKPLFTYQIDLDQGLNRIWEGFTGNLRKKIKKAVENNIQVREGDWREFQFIQKRRVERSKELGKELKPLDDYFRDVFAHYFPKNLKVFVAERNEEILSGAVTLTFKNKASLWIGTHKSKSGLHSNDLLIWEVIKWCHKAGFKLFEIIDHGMFRRLCRFKSKFNPESKIWFSVSKYSSEKIRLAKDFWRILKSKL